MSEFRATRALGALGMALAAGCQAFAPTIAQRAGQPQLAPEDVRVSLGEEHPEVLEPAPPQAEPVPALAPAPYVPPRVGSDERVAIELRNAPLSQVLHLIAERAGVNVYLEPGLDRTVDLSFPSITLDDALQAVLRRNGLRLVEEPAGVFWIELHDGSQPAQASFTVQSIQAGEVEPNLRALISPASTLVIDNRQNLIVVRGTQADVDAVGDYIARVDRLQRQVLIEVRILEITLKDEFELGIDNTVQGTVDGHFWDLAQSLTTADQSFVFNFASENGNVESTVNALRRLTGTDLVSSPRVLAVTGTEAFVEVITEVPYVNVTSTTSGTTGGVGTAVVEEVLFKEAGVKLKVTPTIQEGGSIAIRIDQELSEVVDTFQDIPILDKRQLKTDLLVQDRSTVVLGGLMQGKRSEVDKGVPGLMDLPLIGRLFRSDEDQSGKRELLIFLTPRIVDAAEASRLTQTFKSAYSQRLRETGVNALESGR